MADALAAVIDIRLRNKANVIKMFHSEVAVRRECPGLQSQIGRGTYVAATAPAALPLSGAELLDELRHLAGVGVDIDGALQHMRGVTGAALYGVVNTGDGLCDFENGRLLFD